MKVSFTIQIELSDVEIESIVPDGKGKVELVLSSGGVQARCQTDEAMSDYGPVNEALLSLAGIQIMKERKGLPVVIHAR